MEDLALFLADAGHARARVSPSTCYNTLIGGPRQPDELDGPEEFHVVLLDNGRTELLADAEQRDALHCIRCGACLNVCPIFRNIGGHTYGTTYAGPDRQRVMTPHLRGLNDFQHLSFASSLCGACTNACPVKIDLHHHLLHNRRNAVRSADRPATERLAFKLWSWTMMNPQRFAFSGWAARAALRAIHALGLTGTRLDPHTSVDEGARRSPDSRQILPRPLERASSWRKLKIRAASAFSRASATRFACLPQSTRARRAHPPPSSPQ